jgi:hypothetical protein
MTAALRPTKGWTCGHDGEWYRRWPTVRAFVFDIAASDGIDVWSFEGLRGGQAYRWPRFVADPRTAMAMADDWVRDPSSVRMSAVPTPTADDRAYWAGRGRGR